MQQRPGFHGSFRASSHFSNIIFLIIPIIYHENPLLVQSGVFVQSTHPEFFYILLLMINVVYLGVAGILQRDGYPSLADWILVIVFMPNFGMTWIQSRCMLIFPDREFDSHVT